VLVHFNNKHRNR